ncbi:PqqD family protein [Embleya sp. NPDC050154]|uniref:PqqD family protein n=1 Tax=Embleya sp. NPDC050154 TaxID=3363988 RepID=UPI00379A6AFD
MRVTPAPGVHWTCTDRGGAILNLRTGRWLLLDPAAARLWQHLADGVHPDTLAESLAVEHGVARERVDADIAAFTDRARAHALLADESPPARRPRRRPTR